MVADSAPHLQFPPGGNCPPKPSAKEDYLAPDFCFVFRILHSEFSMMRSPWHTLVILITACGLFGCHAKSAPEHTDSKTVVKGTVTKLIQIENGNFRYYGSVRLTEPAHYRDKEIELFIISHEHDVRDFVGKTISAVIGVRDLTMSVEPEPDLFSASASEPELSMEFAGGAFSPIDFSRYAEPVTISGVVHAYEPQKNKNALYFMFDVGYSGDLVSVKIIEPSKYRGVILHVVADGLKNESGPPSRWEQIGSKVTFTVPEAVLAWEPWGFVPFDQLGKVSIEAASVSATQ